MEHGEKNNIAATSRSDQNNAPPSPHTGKESVDNTRAISSGGTGTSPVPLLNPIYYLVVGALLLVSYFLLAAEIDFFVDPDISYVYPETGRVPWEELEQSYMRYIPYRQMGSMFWKILLLLPGTVCMSLFFALKGTTSFSTRALFNSRTLPIYLFAISLVLIILFVNVVFKQTHITDDELVYDLQARILKEGKFYAEPPPVADSFDTWFVITEGKYTGKYTIGHPLLIMIGMVLGSPYALTVLLSGLLILIIHRITLLLYNNNALALLAGFLLLISPLYILTSSTLLSHTTSAFFLGLFMLSFLLADNNNTSPGKRFLFSIMAGFSIGYCVNVRPLTAVGFGILFALILLAHLIRKRPGTIRIIAGMVIGFLPVIMFTLWYNKIITGSRLEFPFHYYNPGERLGFGAMLSEGHYIHTPMKSLVNLAVSVARMNAFLLGFPVSLIFAAIVLFTRTLHPGDRLCLGIVVAFCFTYLFYHSPGISDTGPVYYYELIIPLIILTARGMTLLHNFITRHAAFLHDSVKHFVVLSIMLAFMTFYPERIIHIMNLTDRVREPYEVVEQNDIHNAVVFIHSKPLAGWVFGFRCNSPGFDDDVIYCNLLSGEKNRKVVEHYPERRYYILYFDSDEGTTKIKRVTPQQLGKVEVNE